MRSFDGRLQQCPVATVCLAADTVALFTEAMVVTARLLAPGLGIVARSRDAEQAGRLYQLGASAAG